MGNVLRIWLERQKLNSAELSRIMKCNPSGVHKWVHGTGCPNSSNAWKLHKLSKGEVPITYWGFTIIDGKIRKLCDGPISLERK